MNSSAPGAAARMVTRSLSTTTLSSSLNPARYSSIVFAFGLSLMDRNRPGVSSWQVSSLDHRRARAISAARGDVHGVALGRVRAMPIFIRNQPLAASRALRTSGGNRASSDTLGAQGESVSSEWQSTDPLAGGAKNGIGERRCDRRIRDFPEPGRIFMALDDMD